MLHNSVFLWSLTSDYADWARPCEPLAPQNDRGEESVQPQLGLTEQDERQPPQGIEPMRGARLGQHIREVEINFHVNSILVPRGHVQSTGQSLHTGGTLGFGHFGNLHFLLLFLLFVLFLILFVLLLFSLYLLLLRRILSLLLLF